MILRVLKDSPVPDFKDEAGLWVRSYTTYNKQHLTRAGSVWKSILARCKTGGTYQEKYPTYIGVTNGFKDFQEFAEWCQSQYGYMNKEDNGKFWSLDKDLKVLGNRVYCPETCIFVPARVNTLGVSCNSRRGDHPVGVTSSKFANRFESYCGDGKGYKEHLGYFDSELEAHQAWQRYKIDLIKRLCQNDLEVASHKELVHCLLGKASKIECDLTEGNQTV